MQGDEGTEKMRDRPRPVAEQVRDLDPRSEEEAMAWIEDVSEFDERHPPRPAAPRALA